MVKTYTANQMINGTYGEVWFDDDYLAEVVSGQAKVSLTYAVMSSSDSITLLRPHDVIKTPAASSTIIHMAVFIKIFFIVITPVHHPAAA